MQNQNQMRESRDTHLDKICDTCGDVGWEFVISTCSRCSIGRHNYCMRVVVRDVIEDWVCEECLSKEKRVACKGPKAVETSKVKFLPTEEVIKLSSGSPKRNYPLESNFRLKHVSAKSTASLSKRSFMGSEAAGPSSNPIKVRPNPRFLQLGSLTPPRRGGLQKSSSSSQHAVETTKESKESDLVPNKEIVCNEQILDAILPNKKQTILPTKTVEALRSCKPSPSRLCTTIVGSGRNFSDAAEPENSDVTEREIWNIRLKVYLFRPHLPALHSTWTGGFKFLDTVTLGEFYGGFVAQPPCRVHRKAYEFSQKMPPVLQVNLLHQSRLQADILQNGCLDLREIALYFYPVDYIERSQQNYSQLFQLMEIKSSVMTSYIDGVRLLIFTSKQLHLDAQDMFARSSTDFFCGVFCCANDNQMEVHQKLPSLASPLRNIHDDNDNANMDSSKAVDMNIDMVGGKVVGIPDKVISKESILDFNEWAAKETLDACTSTVLVESDSVIQPISVKFELECCNESVLSSKSTEEIKSSFTLEPLEHPLESSLGRLPGSMGETDIPPGFEGMLKLSSSNRTPKAQCVEEKNDLNERRIASQVKEEFGCQGSLQIAFGVTSLQPQGSFKNSCSRGSQKQHQVLACRLVTDPLAGVKCSVAGRSRGNSGAAGGLIRDMSGKWIVGYKLSLGICNSLSADLWALFQGIKFAWDRGYRNVLVESDSVAAVDCLRKGPSLLDSNLALITGCRDLISRKWDCKVYPIRREENFCANWLANHVERCLLGLSIINQPPLELKPFLENDCIRVAHTHDSPSELLNPREKEEKKKDRCFSMIKHSSSHTIPL